MKSASSWRSFPWKWLAFALLNMLRRCRDVVWTERPTRLCFSTFHRSGQVAGFAVG
jgi:hypothetical protein